LIVWVCCDNWKTIPILWTFNEQCVQSYFAKFMPEIFGISLLVAICLPAFLLDLAIKIVNYPKNIINLPKTECQVLGHTTFLQSLTFEFSRQNHDMV
jgi:hypothetical protein